MSLRKKLVGIVAGLLALLLAVLVAVQFYFTRTIGGLYRSNVEITMRRVASDVRGTFAGMSDTVLNLAENSAVRDYVTTADSEDRYRKAYGSVASIVKVATTNLNFDHLLIADNANSWFRFLGALSGEGCDTLRSLFWNEQELVNTVLTLDGTTFFCTVKRIYALEGQQLQTVGLVVALAEVDKTRRALQVYQGYQNISILLHNYDTVFLSLDPALEGVPVARLEELNAKSYVLEQAILPASLGLVVSVPTEAFYPQRAILAVLFLSVGVLAVLGIILLSVLINRMLVGPFHQVILGTRRLGGDDLSRRLPQTGVPYVDILVGSINSMLTRLEGYNERELAAMQEIYELEIAQQKAQMYLLRHQIDRHFLYNSLTSIRALSENGEAGKAGAVAAGIARLLQYTSSRAEEVNLFDELQIIQLYVQIQNIRFDDRVAFEADVDDRLCEYRILKLVIQPLVENALVHGLEQRTEGCELRVRGYLHQGVIYIEVRDNGAGIPAEKLAGIQRSLLHAESVDVIDGLEGVALLNVQKRIAAAYGDTYGLTVSSEVGVHTTVRLCLPAVPDTG